MDHFCTSLLLLLKQLVQVPIFQDWIEFWSGTGHGSNPIAVDLSGDDIENTINVGTRLLEEITLQWSFTPGKIESYALQAYQLETLIGILSRVQNFLWGSFPSTCEFVKLKCEFSSQTAFFFPLRPPFWHRTRYYVHLSKILPQHMNKMAAYG